MLKRTWEIVDRKWNIASHCVKPTEIDNAVMCCVFHRTREWVGRESLFPLPRPSLLTLRQSPKATVQQQSLQIHYKRFGKSLWLIPIHLELKCLWESVRSSVLLILHYNHPEVGKYIPGFNTNNYNSHELNHPRGTSLVICYRLHEDGRTGSWGFCYPWLSHHSSGPILPFWFVKGIPGLQEEENILAP